MQQKSPNRILAMLSISCFFNSMHFYLLDQLTAFFIFLFASIRFLISIHCKSQLLALVALWISLAVTILTYEGYLSILGFTGTVFIIFGSISSSDKTLRLMMITGSAIWLLHNAILGTPIGILLEAVFVSSGLIGLYRFYVMPNR